MRKAFVFCGGVVTSYDELPILTNDEDLIICADSGVKHCVELNLSPDIWVGDFDSSDFEALAELELMKNTEIIKLSPCKDDTDTEHAVRLAINMGIKNIVVVGGFGGRLDHTLANAFLAEEANRNNATLTLVDEKNILHYLKDDTLCIKKSKFKYISVIPIENSVVSCDGFRYPLHKEIILRGPSRGVSNELIEDEGFITLHSGCAFIVESAD